MDIDVTRWFLGSVDTKPRPIMDDLRVLLLHYVWKVPEMRNADFQLGGCSSCLLMAAISFTTAPNCVREFGAELE